MATVTCIADDVYRLTSAAMKMTSGDILNCSMVFLVVNEGKPALIDTIPVIVKDPILDAIRGLGYDPANISDMIPTHIHLDAHAGTVSQRP